MSESLLPLSLSYIYDSPDTIALYWLASRMIFAPATIIAESLRPQIYRGIAAHEPPLLPYILKISVALGGVLAIPVFILLFAGEVLFTLAFGPQWAAANDYAVMLGLLVVINMVALPFVGALPRLKMQGAMLAAELIGLAARAFIIFVMTWNSPYEMVTACTLSYGFVVVVMLIYVAFVLNKKGQKNDWQLS